MTQPPRQKSNAVCVFLPSLVRLRLAYLSCRLYNPQISWYSHGADGQTKDVKRMPNVAVQAAKEPTRVRIRGVPKVK
ncbi:hypothetical protein ScPMuIL_003227 [Solemya velum]